MADKVTRAIIFGAAPCDNWSFLQDYLNHWQPCLVFCADGGVKGAAAAGLQPDYLVGDWDSGGAPSEKLPCMTLPSAKDLTDLEAVIHLAAELGVRELLLCGCTGGRLDHTVSNLMLLEYISALGISALIVDEANEVRLLDGGILRLKNDPPYRYLSLIPLDRQITGVAIQGVKYPLKDAVLTRGSTFSISNEPAAAVVTVAAETGRMLLIRSQRLNGKIPCAAT